MKLRRLFTARRQLHGNALEAQDQLGSATSERRHSHQLVRHLRKLFQASECCGRLPAGADGLILRVSSLYLV